MEVKFLQQEEKFHQYNAQLELKASALMKEVERVMTIRDPLAFSPKINLGSGNAQCTSTDGCHDSDEVLEACDAKHLKYSRGLGTLSTRSGSLSSLHTLREFETNTRTPRENARVDLSRENKSSSASNNIIKILNTKIKILQNEGNNLRTDLRKKVDELKKYQNVIKQLEDEKNKALSQVEALKEESMQCRLSSSDIASKLHLRDTENASLKKEVDSLKKELKAVTQGMNHNEVRMNRALEEIEKLKSALQESNLHEKELRTSARRNTDQLTSVIRKLEKQKTEILHAFRKQVLLIENLKSQKEVEEAVLMTKLTEKNFSGLLDFIPKLSK